MGNGNDTHTTHRGDGYKVCYVAKGYTQQHRIDYDKTTAPTARLESLRTILHFVASLNWDIQHFDIWIIPRAEHQAFISSVTSSPPSETRYLRCSSDWFSTARCQAWSTVMASLLSLSGVDQT